MVFTRARNTDRLAIALKGKHAFFPGETIVGTVSRKAKYVDPEAVVSVTFSGGASVNVEHRSPGDIGPNIGGSMFSNIWFNQDIRFWKDPIEQELYRGPVHVPEAGEEPVAWNFSLTIPSQADETVFDKLSLETQEKEFFVKQTEPGAYDLHSSFTSGLGKKEEFYIEYVLVAHLTDSRGEAITAVLPITVLRSFTPTPISDFGLKESHNLVRAVYTSRLDPNNANPGRGFKQKAKALFNSDKVRLTVRLSVEVPSIVQIGHPEALPFHLRAIMIPKETSEVVHGTDPAIVVTKFKVTIDERSWCVAPGYWSNSTASNRQTWTLLSWWRRSEKKTKSTSGNPSPQPSPAPSFRGSLESSEHVQAGPSTGTGATNDFGMSLVPPGYEKYDRPPTATHSRRRSLGSSPDYAAGSSGGSGTREELEPPAYQRHDPGASQELPPDPETLIIPWESAMLPLDLGKALDVRVPIKLPDWSQDAQPTFTFVSMKSEHTLVWELEVEIAGEDVHFNGRQQIMLLGRSDDDPTRFEPPKEKPKGPWVA